MTRFALLLSLVLTGTGIAADNALIGAWQKDGAPHAELRKDGTGVVQGENVRWSTAGNVLTIAYQSGRTDMMFYKLSGKTLTVLIDGETHVFTKGSSKPSAKAAAPGAAKTTAAGSDSLSKLLLSSAWCSFSYNKISGASHESRVVFRKDGTWSTGARSESYSSGSNGSIAGQTDSSGGGRWKVQGGRLLMAEGGAAPQDIGLTVSRNSNGYPILESEGKEYSQCR